jgi:hypothetical protein
VGWWFVPLANYVQPFRAVRELSRRAGGQARERPLLSEGLLWSWWLLYNGTALILLPTLTRLVPLFVGSFDVRSGLREVTIPAADIRWLAAWWAVGALMQAVAAVLAIRVVQGISHAEDAEPPVQIANVGLPAPPRPDIR